MRTTNEQRVCKQLLEAILFERIEPFIEHRRQGQTTFRFVRPSYELTVDGKRGAFDRVWLDIETVVLTRGNHEQSPTLEHIMDCFQLAEPLRLELRQTVQFADACPTFPEPRTHLSYEQLEQALVEGHPYHPCFKSRIGFSRDDHSRYGPEAGQRFRLHFVALPVSIVHQQRMDGVMEQTFGHETYLRLQEKLSSAVDDPTGYHVLPVHPWQWQHVEADVRTSGGIDLGEAGPLFQATQSYPDRLSTGCADGSAHQASARFDADFLATDVHRSEHCRSTCFVRLVDRPDARTAGDYTPGIRQSSRRDDRRRPVGTNRLFVPGQCLGGRVTGRNGHPVDSTRSP